jgi:quinoprotein dehydrogenase-associated probable ABC transporter substrate-binding protein
MRTRRWIGVVVATAALGASTPAQAQERQDPSAELIDPTTLRVCADPHNMPFSSETGDGFENKLADLLAAKLGKTVAYTWFPQATGFVRNTLGTHRCDVIMGFAQGDELAQVTNPYYRTAYALVFRRDSPLEGVAALSDPRLQGKRIGIVAGTPPATYMALNGLLGRAKPYPLMIDTRIDSSAEAMMRDLASGEIEAGVLWGPMAGFYGKRAEPPMRVVPLVSDSGGPRLVYRITMGVRASDQNWKRQLNRFIQENQPAINALLAGYGVPLLDERNEPLAADVPGK